MFELWSLPLSLIRVALSPSPRRCLRRLGGSSSDEERALMRNNNGADKQQALLRETYEGE